MGMKIEAAYAENCTAQYTDVAVLRTHGSPAIGAVNACLSWATVARLVRSV